jgi:catechol 2,3-dioxygenase-like lactoylglutathione lyase family enzyme
MVGMTRQVQVAVDCADPARLVAFWASVLGYQPQDAPGDDWAALVDPQGVRPRLLFHRVPEGKVVKNRVHLDVRVSGEGEVPMAARRPLVDAEAVRLAALGATHLRTDDDGVDYFAVLQDPEGNEFCIN